MQLQTLKVSECYESETNPRGAKFEGVQFDELVASIKEKGVLVPVLARPCPTNPKRFEIVAGSRRLRAAMKAGLTEIPAQVEQSMTDDEAREAQIVENLQRADVHPLEEGEAYRQLIEDGGRTVKDVAVKVGKSEDYVRQRLFLTNLAAPLAKAYRAGDLPDSQAAIIARLSEPDQVATFKYIKDAYNVDAKHLKEYIERTFYHPLAFQPWMTDKDIAAIVGLCKECPPVREALFGTVKSGQCTNLKCWRRKMDAYLMHRMNSGDELMPIVKQYGEPDRKKFAGQDVLTQNKYEGLPSNKKKHCEFAEQGLVIDGPDTGTVIWICSASQCKDHHYQHSEYVPSEKEKAKRKKEREKEAALHQKFDATIAKALEKVKWPLSEKHLDALFDFVLSEARTNGQMPIVKRHGLTPQKKKTSYGMARDYETPLRDLAKEGGKDSKLRIIFELLLPTYNRYDKSGDVSKRIAKL